MRLHPRSLGRRGLPRCPCIPTGSGLHGGGLTGTPHSSGFKSRETPPPMTRGVYLRPPHDFARNRIPTHFREPLTGKRSVGSLLRNQDLQGWLLNIGGRGSARDPPTLPDSNRGRPPHPWPGGVYLIPPLDRSDRAGRQLSLKKWWCPVNALMRSLRSATGNIHALQNLRVFIPLLLRTPIYYSPVLNCT